MIGRLPHIVMSATDYLSRPIPILITPHLQLLPLC